jgi:hypothetical protein
MGCGSPRSLPRMETHGLGSHGNREGLFFFIIIFLVIKKEKKKKEKEKENTNTCIISILGYFLV